MDRLIYIAMTGAKHSLEQQATVANNLANVSTTAFKAQLSAYRAVPVVGPNSSTRAFVVGSTIGVSSQLVTNGNFSAPLNFGAAAIA